MAFILGRATAFSAEDRGRAEEVVETREFRNWVTSKERSSLGDGALLIHGDYDLGDYPEISPLSALCVAFVQMLRIRHDKSGRNKDKRLEHAIQEAQGYPVYEKYAKHWKRT
ncbi:hypothetical protein COL516b_004266 [Colletotrichum fioriniae]|nr:uncharacterized protein COL516b_004266 [Colletotrichum fioriniae]KAJ0307034.1 hypothetical protein COL516b_004266 [Colletotrichum fioriniae]